MICVRKLGPKIPVLPVAAGEKVENKAADFFYISIFIL